ncbi:MAG: hypothetical protein Tsb0026_00130 [Sulfuricaulis sp.]
MLASGIESTMKEEMKKNATKQRDAGVWRTEALRLTAFTDLAVQTESLADWNSLVGRPPAQRNSQIAIKQVEEFGPFGKGVLAINASPGRIDLQYQPILDVATLGNTWPDIGSLPESLEEFVPLALKWLDMTPSLRRLAFGAEVSIPASNHDEAYKLLDFYLPAVSIDLTTTDFNYAINRKRPSSSNISGLIVNRLSRWYALARRFMVKKPDGIAATVEFLVCRLELDINTGPEFATDLPKDKHKDIFHELVSFAVEIAEKGDVP